MASRRAHLPPDLKSVASGKDGDHGRPWIGYVHPEPIEQDVQDQSECSKSAGGRTSKSTASGAAQVGSVCSALEELNAGGSQSRPLLRYQSALKRRPASSPVWGVHCNSSRDLRMSY